MTEQSDFPAQHYNQAGKEKAPRQEVSDKQQRREHHKMSPVENAAVHTASVFHEEALERAPQNHADQVSHVVKKRQHYKFFGVDNAGHIKRPKNCVE